MSKAEILSAIETSLNEILKRKGVSHVAVQEDLTLFNGGIPIDSLDLAQIVLELQSRTRHDPFETGFVEFHTAGELAALFAA